MCPLLHALHTSQHSYGLLREDDGVDDVDEAVAALDVAGDDLGVVHGQLIHRVSDPQNSIMTPYLSLTAGLHHKLSS